MKANKEESKSAEVPILPITVILIYLAIIVAIVFVAVLPDDVSTAALGTFSARYVSILISALPFVVLAALIEPAISRIRRLSKLRSVSVATDAALRGLNPAFLAALVVAFGDSPVIIIVVVAYSLAAVGVAALVERASAIGSVPSGARIAYFDELVSVLYDLLRWTIFSALLAAVFHTALPALGFAYGASVPAPVAAGVGIAAGVILCIPYPAVPFAATLFFGLLPPSGIVAFVLAAALLPANKTAGIVATRRAHLTGPSTKRTFAAIAAVAAMAVVLYAVSLPISSLSFEVQL
jgi:hypothetical protein